MKKMQRHICGLCLLMTLLIPACVSLEQAAPPVAMLGLPLNGSKVIAIARRREIYITRCAKCHSVEPVKSYTPAEWKKIMPVMVEKTKLSPEDDVDVRAYVTAVLGHRD